MLTLTCLIWNSMTQHFSTYHYEFTGCMGQPLIFNDFNKSYSRYKRENLCDSSERIGCQLQPIKWAALFPYCYHSDSKNLLSAARWHELANINFIIVYGTVKKQDSGLCARPSTGLWTQTRTRIWLWGQSHTLPSSEVWMILEVISFNLYIAGLVPSKSFSWSTLSSKRK